MKRILCAIRFGFFAYRNPNLFYESYFLGLSQIFDLMLKVATENRPYMTKLGVVNIETNDRYELVSIWACPSSSDDPTARIRQLVEENESLKRLVGK